MRRQSYTTGGVIGRVPDGGATREARSTESLDGCAGAPLTILSPPRVPPGQPANNPQTGSSGEKRYCFSFSRVGIHLHSLSWRSHRALGLRKYACMSLGSSSRGRGKKPMGRYDHRTSVAGVMIAAAALMMFGAGRASAQDLGSSAPMAPAGAAVIGAATADAAGTLHSD